MTARASVVIGQRYSAGGPRIAGLLSLATEQALAAINGEVASLHPELGLTHLQIFHFDLDRRAPGDRTHMWIGAGRFAHLWSALQEITGRSDPQPTAAAEWVDGGMRARTLFVAEPHREAEVRRRIEAALARGQLCGMNGVTTRWQLLSSEPSAVFARETVHVRALPRAEASADHARDSSPVGAALG